MKAGASGIDADNSGVMLVGRCEGFLVGQADLNMVIDRLNAYADAGADCLYAPGIRTKEQIAEVVKAVHPKRSIFCLVRPGFPSRKPPISASAASASAVRWHAPPGAVLWAGRVRSRSIGRLPNWATAFPAGNFKRGLADAPGALRGRRKTIHGPRGRCAPSSPYI